MTATRGAGVGLEVAPDVVRGVRLAIDEPGRVAAVCDVPIVRFDDDAEVIDTLVRARGRLGDSDGPTRVAWFPTGTTLQRIDITGRSMPELKQLRHELADQHGVHSSMVVDADARKWLLALRWDHDQATRLVRLIERAGFTDVSIEPAPMALQRVQPHDTTAVRRDVSDGHSWMAVVSGSVPLAAVAADGANDGSRRRPAPAMTVDDGDPGVNRLDSMLSTDELFDDVGRLFAAGIGTMAPGAEPDVDLHLLDERYPPFPAHDLRGPQRVAVALGAALGAAGLAGRLHPVDVVTSVRPADGSQPRPWAIERLADAPFDDRQRKQSVYVRIVEWWQRRGKAR